MPKPPLIRKLAPIKDVGVLRDVRANSTPEFLQYNLIYGFNGSGKTTLSRIFASLEAGSLRKELPEGGTFEVQLTDNTTIDSVGPLDRLKSRLLVFNTDFIEESFKWKDGTARPVFYLGRQQANLADKLARTASDKQAAETAKRAADALVRAKERSFTELKRTTARLIAEQLNLGRRYDAGNLALDIERTTLGTADLVRDDSARQNLRLAATQEAPLPKLPALPTAPVAFATFIRQTRAIVNTAVIRNVLADLQGHDEMNAWLAEGLKYHATKHLTKCLFCANELAEERVKVLQNVFDEAFERHQAKIQRLRETAADIQRTIVTLREALPSNNDMSQALRPQFVKARAALLRTLVQMENRASAAADVLAKKQHTPQSVPDLAPLGEEPEAESLDESATAMTANIRDLLLSHNREFDAFTEAKAAALKRLKTHYLAEAQPTYRQLQHDLRRAQEAADKLAAQIAQLERAREDLEKEVREHGPAAKVITTMIHSYLGRKDIELAPREDGYELRRNGKAIRGSLSEGEKTAIALCYFLSTLAAEGRKRKDLIVVIDDPVSSLDTQALNYAFTIVRAVVSDAGQLFLMTHNLNFLNEAKKWLKPKTEREAEKRGKVGSGTATLLFLDAVQTGDKAETRAATIKELPKYIREYESEYQYLFYLALQFAASANEENEYFYILPNALRKIMDTFLAFKIPGSQGLASKIEMVAKMDHGLDPARVYSLERLVQVESHADNLDDLVTLSSMTVEETREATKTLLTLVEALDKEHYKQMKSICAP